MAEKKPKKRILEQLKLDGFWDNMSPNQRRGATVVGGISGLLLLMGVLTGGDDTKTSKTRESVKRSVLTDVNTRSIGIDALNAKVKTVVKENSNLTKTVDRLKKEIAEIKRRRGNNPDVTRQIGVLESQIKNITRKAQSIGWDVEDIKEGYFEVPGQEGDFVDAPTVKTKTQNISTLPVVKAVETKVVKKKKPASVEAGLNQDPSYYFRTAPVRPAAPAPVAGAPSLKNGALEGGGLVIRTVVSVSQANENDSQRKETFIPAGSVISGITLNGLDAATGRGARKDPFPVVVRVQKEAILPNEYTADIRECFATLAGYGELSSERAMLRGEAFSCITNDGEIIEVDLPAYAVGEDGKAGIRGRLVSKAGSLIAKTAIAGFGAGIAEAFDSSPVPVIQTAGVSSERTYQDNFSSNAGQHGASKGASAALTRLADYYMDMADQIFPVIEVDAGRQIDIIVTTGFRLKIKKLNNIKLASKR